MLIEATGKALTYRWPHGEVRLEPGRPVELPDDRANRLLAKAPGRVRAVEALRIVEHGRDSDDSIFVVKIGGSVAGEFWFCLSDTEPFDPGDGLPVYRPSEIRALKAKGYGPEALQAVHRVKTILDGRILS
ncbi:MAG: hypothetical protein D4R81_05185 [Nitrospiraceae bacterium]|nr:MAG: hypothetical protein D4R81_05185 [Nitrospiraceae bacterium]